MQGHVLTEGHQFLLQVSACTFACRGDAVVVPPLAVHHFANRHAGDQCRLAIVGEAAHDAEVAFGLILQDRHRRFRPDDQVRLSRAQGHVAVESQLRFDVCRVPLQVLFDVALQCSHRQRLARRSRPGMAL